MKKQIKKTLELSLNSEISVDKKGKESIEISGQYQKMLNRITNEICKEFKKMVEKMEIKIPKGKHQGKSWCPQCEDTGYNYALEDILKKL